MSEHVTDVLRFALPFTDRAVVQADKPLPIWGGPAGAAVTITCNEQQQHAVASSMTWHVTMSAVAAGKTVSLTATTNEAAVSSNDLLAGDVFCAVANQIWNGASIKLTAPPIEMRWRPMPCVMRPQIMFLPAIRPTTSPRPGRLLAVFAGQCSVVVFTLRTVFINKLDDRSASSSMPSVGMIEAWMPREVVLAIPEGQRRAEGVKNHQNLFAAMRDHFATMEAWLARTGADLAAAKPGISYDKFPDFPQKMGCNAIAACWNALMAPLRGLSLAGVLWYQGESNADCPEDYAALFRLLISTWRQHFNQPDLPFYWVQLAGWMPDDKRGHNGAANFDGGFVGIRAAQDACLELPQTGMVSAIDVGDRLNIHPFRKQILGRRLADLCLAQQYDFGHCRGTRLLSAMQSGSRITVTCSQYLVPTLAVRALNLNARGLWHAVAARANGKEITLIFRRKINSNNWLMPGKIGKR